MPYIYLEYVKKANLEVTKGIRVGSIHLPKKIQLTPTVRIFCSLFLVKP